MEELMSTKLQDIATIGIKITTILQIKWTIKKIISNIKYTRLII